MARKKKKTKNKAAKQQHSLPLRDETLEEELGALQAIYDDGFEILDDRLGCSVLVAPYPTGEDAPLSVIFEARFPAGYPAQAMSVLIRQGPGHPLPVAQVHILQTKLQATAEQCAKNGEVAVFTLASEASDWLQLYIEEHPGEEQESLYDQYQQREQTMQRKDCPDMSPERLAALTQRWVEQTACLPVPSSMALHDVPVSGSQPFPRPVPQDPVCMSSSAPIQAQDMKVKQFLPRTFRQGTPASNVTSLGSPIATALSRSVGVASQLAQHVKRGGSAQKRISGANGEADQMNSVLKEEMRNSDMLQQAVIGASIHRTLTGQGLSDEERAATIVLMQQAGVISRETGRLLLQPEQLKRLCASVARHSGSVFRTELADFLHGAQTHAVKASGLQLATRSPLGGQQDMLGRPKRREYPRGPPSLHATTPCRYHQDFVEHEQLGQGGFGVVVAAVNRVDGRKYAIKKIPMGNAASPARVLLEVSTLSGLYHAHVVRYFQAWREEDQSVSTMKSCSSSDLFVSRPSHTNQSASTLHAAGSMRRYSTSSLQHVHAPGLSLKGAEPLEINGHTHAPKLRLDTVAETSADRGASPPSESRAQMPYTIPDRSQASSTKEHSPPDTDLRWQHEEGVSSDPDNLSDDTSGSSWSTPTHDSTANSIFTFDKRTHLPNSASETSDGVTFHKEGKHEVLYIQMEYCPTTLRKQLARGPLEDQQRWRVVRQLLSSLAYVHRRGIIHRDVKPDNVFYDARNDIKLGDFGLAKFTSSQTSLHPELVQDEPAGDAMSSDVGTEIYMAPEVKRGGTYGSKVDLFSLGICVVEIWVQFDTEMERICMLRQCHEGRLPEEMWKQHPLAARLASALLAHDPSQRPTAAEVLKSHLLPASVADEQVTDILRALPDNPGMYEKIVDALFAVPSTRDHQSEPAGDSGEQLAVRAQLGSSIVSSESMAAAGVPTPGNPALILSMFRAVEKICTTHGFVPMQSWLIGTCSGAAGARTVRLLSTAGQQLSLRSELRLPFCMWLVNQAAKSAGAFGMPVAPKVGLESMRRYEIAQVFTGAADATPDWHTDIDIIDAVRSDQGQVQSESSIILSDAEILLMVLDIISSIDATRGCAVEVRLSHSNLLLAVLDHAGVSASVQASFLQAILAYQQAQVRDRIQKTDRRPKDWAELCQAMQQMQVPIGRAKPLLQQLPSDAAEAVGWLRNILPVASDQSACTQALQQLECLIDLLTTLGVTSSNDNVSVAVNPFMPIPAAYHDSLIYQVHVILPWSNMDRNAAEAESACELVCSGGRFDALLQSMWPWQLRNEHVPAPFGTGATLDMSALERISRVLVGSKQRACRNGRPLSAADVLVASRGGGGMLRQRMQVLQLLWQGDISAETMHAVDPSLMEQYTHAKSRNMRCIVLLAQHQLEVKSQVKVKPLERRMGEEDVPLSILVCRLSEILAQR